jgi:hypothetical protein
VEYQQRRFPRVHDGRDQGLQGAELQQGHVLRRRFVRVQVQRDWYTVDSELGRHHP